MIIKKQHYISFGIDLLASILVFLVFPLHQFLISLHPFYKVMTSYTKDQISQNPEILANSPHATSGVPYVLLMVLLTIVLMFVIFIYSRAFLYKLLLKKKSLKKMPSRTTKTIFAGIPLVYLPAGVILGFIFFIINLVLLAVLLPFKSIAAFTVSKMIFRVFLTLAFFHLVELFYLYGVKEKHILKNYYKLVSHLKEKAFYLNTLYASIVMLLVVWFNVKVLAKIAFMYSSFSFMSMNVSLAMIWFLIIGLVTITYLRFSAIRIMK